MDIRYMCGPTKVLTELNKLRHKNKGYMKEPNSNSTVNHKIRDHAKREVTLHYDQCMDTMKKTISKCPICKEYKWKIELLHLLEIKSFLDNTPLGIINHITNLIPEACIDCHRYFDAYTKSKFNNLPTPIKIKWYKHRIKVFQAGKKLSNIILYKYIGRYFESPVNFDIEINKLRYKIKKLRSIDFFNWTPDILKSHMENPINWYKGNINIQKIIEDRNTTLFKFEQLALNDNGKLPIGVKRFDKVRPSSRREYRFSNIPYVCIMCGCNHTLEVVHIKPLEYYLSSNIGIEFNNTDVTAPLCKGCHGILDGNKYIKTSNYYTEWIKEFNDKHDQFRKKNRLIKFI